MKTLVDSSVWVAHLRRPERDLVALLERGEVLTHPFVLGELACGDVRRREEVLGSLAMLPRVTLASHEGALLLLERHALWGRGLGWVDIHLLASAALTEVELLTFDRRLRTISALILRREGRP